MHTLSVLARDAGRVVLFLWYAQLLLCVLAAIGAGVLARRPLSAPLWALTWSAMATLSYVLAIAGLPIVALLAFREWWGPGRSALGHPITVWSPRWAWPWSNLEDGVIPPQLVNGNPYMLHWSERWRAFVWCAWRNKVSNLRFTPLLGFTVQPAKIKGAGNAWNLYERPTSSPVFSWSVASQGPYAGAWFVFRPLKRQLRVGWALVPADASGFNPADLRQLRCGFTLQLNAAA